MRKWRNLTRILVLFGMALLASYNLYEKKAGQLGSEDEISESVVLSVFNTVLAKENKPMLFRGYVEGGLWSIRILALSLSDPTAFAASSTAGHAIDLTLLWSVLIPIGLILVFGRFFCAWICPYSLFAEAGNGLRRVLQRLGINYFRFDLPRHSALSYLVTSLILGAVLSVPITTFLYPPRLLTEAVYHLVVSGLVTSGVIFLVLLWAGEVILSPHLFCRRLCPGGALFSLLGRWRWWRVRKVESLCDYCGACNPVCPYKLNPAQARFGSECDNCGLCIDACHKNARAALVYAWSRKG